MKKSQAGFMVFGCLFVVLLSFGQSWAQNPPTMLIVVRASDDTLWKMTCNEGTCSPFSSFPGLFRYQPTVTWDEAAQEWVVVGTAADNSIWMATFDRQGNFNDDWQSLPGLTPSPAGVSSSLYKMGGDIKTDRWLNSDTNTFIGVGVVGAGNLTHTTYDEGWYNTAFGYQTLYSITTGQENTAIGNHALRSNTTGVENTASGSGALFSNTTGYSNTASGSEALYYNTTGYSNTASGSGALLSNTTGYSNTASGESALYSNTQGSENTASGVEALYSNTGGNYNTASGAYALSSNTIGMWNTASGSSALYFNTAGYNNTALGYNAGDTETEAYANTTGSNNTFIGAYSGPGTSTQLTNATAIGYRAMVSADNSLILGATGADQVKVGIGTQTPGWMLHVNGTAAKPGGGSWTDTSDIRLKKSVRTIENALGKILTLRGVEFEWNGNERVRLLPGTQMGMIAQEVETVFPQWVGTDRQGYKDLTFRGFEALTVEAMRELKAENEVLKNRLSDLEKRLLLMERTVTVSK